MFPLSQERNINIELFFSNECPLNLCGLWQQPIRPAQVWGEDASKPGPILLESMEYDTNLT